MKVQYAAVTEVGGFDYAANGLATIEAGVKTRFACATLPISRGYANWGPVLVKAGWVNIGNRLNKSHGPNYISLWWKEFPKLGEVKPGVGEGYGYTYNSGSFHCCGLRIGWKDIGSGGYLEVIECDKPGTGRIKTLRANGFWPLGTFGDHRYWTNAGSEYLAMYPKVAAGLEELANPTIHPGARYMFTE